MPITHPFPLHTLLMLSLIPFVLSIPLSFQSPLLSPPPPLNPYPTKPRLTFRPDGSFKITVFSDLHFGENPWDAWGPQQDVNSTRLMNIVLGSEKPDYVVLNGDLITGENTFKENSTKLIDEIVAPLNRVKVPFSSTYGNHDNQVNITHAQEMARELAIAPLSYTRPAPPGVGGEGGPGNYWVPIYESLTDKSPAVILWFFDSRGGVKTDGSVMPDWVDATVAPWIQSEVDNMNVAWGSTGRRNLVFVHIPPSIIPPLQASITRSENPGLNADPLSAGDGSVQSPTDSTFFAALNEHIGTENIIALVSGHDHGDEWCTLAPTSTETELTFCFDKHSGYGGYSDDGWNYGVRNFVLTSTGVKSWIRYEAGSTKAHVDLSQPGTIVVESA